MTAPSTAVPPASAKVSAPAAPPRTDRLSFVEKAGYSLGDAAANFVFMTMILFQLSFYTDTLGITAAAAGTMLLVGRLWDAFFDPMMGVLRAARNPRGGNSPRGCPGPAR